MLSSHQAVKYPYHSQAHEEKQHNEGNIKQIIHRQPRFFVSAGIVSQREANKRQEKDSDNQENIKKCGFSRFENSEVHVPLYRAITKYYFAILQQYSHSLWWRRGNLLI